MATINIVVPPLQARTYTGGIFCIARYAVGLREMGHTVNLIPILPSPYPQWIEGDFGAMPDGSRRAVWCGILREFARLLKLPGAGRSKQMSTREVKQRLTNAIGFACPRLFHPLLHKALQLAYVAEHMPPADVTLATSYKTALAVHFFGTGHKFYFAQHYEPLLAFNAPDPGLAAQETRLAHQLDLRLIANSTWLKRKLEQELQLRDVPLCVNAIQHHIFNGEIKPAERLQAVRIISYGGGKVQWKGFADMAQGMRLARERLPDLRLHWQVYGGALMPPDNEVASYQDLGFLHPSALAAAYRAADFLLSASWFESFPLFPIEAMACGLPVITTQIGTEDYAIPDETALVVEPRNPQSVANAIVRLATDGPLRLGLAQRGQRCAHTFTWEAAAQRMAHLLLGH